AEYLDEIVKCRTLFATHYHELTALADTSDTVANVSVSAEEVQGDIVFLHRLVKGAASRSYGVAVGKLAGLPESVLARARALLETLESGGMELPRQGSGPKGHKPKKETPQLALFAPAGGVTGAEKEVLDTIKGVEVERITPL